MQLYDYFREVLHSIRDSEPREAEYRAGNCAVSHVVLSKPAPPHGFPMRHRETVLTFSAYSAALPAPQTSEGSAVSSTPWNHRGGGSTTLALRPSQLGLACPQRRIDDKYQ